METTANTIQRRIADVFNREYQAHRDGEKWQSVMRSIAEEIAFTLYPDSPQGQQDFMDNANWSGLFTNNH